MNSNFGLIRAFGDTKSAKKTGKLIRIISVFLCTVLCSFTLFLFLGAWTIAQIEERTKLFSRLLNLPKVNQHVLVNFPFIQSSRVFDRNGKEIGCYAKEYRIVVPLRDINPHLLNAIIASEDKRFRSHPGFDWISITRATISNATHQRVVSGASTITQQLVKNCYLTSERSLDRKIKELILAMQVEQKLTKDEILYLYVNMVYLGGPQGVEAASYAYFNKSAKHVSVAESAFIAGLIHTPGLLLKGEEGWRKAYTRKEHVLDLMQQSGFIDKEQYEKAKKEQIAPRMFSGSCEKVAPYITEEVRKKYRPTLPVLTGGLRFYTTVDSSIQRKAEEACRSQLEQYLLRHPEYRDDMQCSSVVVKVETGEILAMVGGQNFNENEYNGVTQSLRQPGSAFKPIVYAALLEQLVQKESQRRNAVMEATGEIGKHNDQKPLDPDPLYDPLIDCTVLDAPISVPMIVNHKGRVVSRHVIHNYPYIGRPRYRGNISCTLALAESRNTPAIRAARRLSVDEMLGMAERLGIETPLQPYITTALGASEMTLIELATAYLPLINGGYKKKLFLVDRVLGANERILDKQQGKSAERVLSPEAAQGMRTMLQAVVDNPLGTAHTLRRSFPSGALAGKTGTATNVNGDATDNWFIGITPRYLIAIRINHVNKFPLGSKETGGRNALPAFTTIVKDLGLLKPDESFPSIIFRQNNTVVPKEVPQQKNVEGEDDEGVPRFKEITNGIRNHPKPISEEVELISPIQLPQ